MMLASTIPTGEEKEEKKKPEKVTFESLAGLIG
jgi:hypothetical protein